MWRGQHYAATQLLLRWTRHPFISQTLHGTVIFTYIGVVSGVNVGIYTMMCIFVGRLETNGFWLLLVYVPPFQGVKLGGLPVSIHTHISALDRYASTKCRTLLKSQLGVNVFVQLYPT